MHHGKRVGPRLARAGLFGAGCQCCRATGIGQRVLVTSAGLTLLLLYCAVSPKILGQNGPGWWKAAGRRPPRDVVLVSEGSPGQTASVCVRRLSPDVVTGPDPAAAPAAGQQIAFLAGVKNPCWLQELIQADSDSLRNHSLMSHNEKFLIKLQKRARLYQPFISRSPAVRALRVHCLPYLYVIGQPKCGTTDLRHRISLHPRMGTAGVKGHGHWWSRRRFPFTTDSPDSEVYQASFREYVDSYELEADQLVGGECGGDGDGDDQLWTPSSQMVTMDGSTSTMWDGIRHREARSSASTAGAPYPPLGETVAAGMAALQPTARIIAILREPVERLFSDYLYFFADRDQDKSGDEFHRMSLHAVDAWTNCTSTRSDEDCSTDGAVVSAFGVRLHVGLYAVYLRQWLQVFAREQVLVLRTEDYKRNVTAAFQKIFTLLELGSPSEATWAEIRDASPLNVRRKNTTQKAMLPETRQLLRNFYRPFNMQLAELLDSELFLWDDVSEH